MRRIVLAGLLLVVQHAGAQVLPVEGSRLNYRLVGFSFPAQAGAATYRVEMASGDYRSEDSFKKNIIITREVSSPKLMAEMPEFGHEYTWRITTVHHDKRVIRGSFHHFSTMTNARADTGKLRLRIMQPAEGYKDDYIAVDAGGVFYDMKGRPVWFIPDTNGFGGYIGDTKVTKDGTITFLYGRFNCEIDLNGDVIWKTPRCSMVNGDTMGEFYHHEFTKLSNGHYMMMGTQVLKCKTVTNGGVTYIDTANAQDRQFYNGYKMGKFGTLIEYDKEGKVVWAWKASQHLIGTDYDYYKGFDSNQRFDPHDNAFYFDEKNSVIYIGFRNINRVVKIAYPGGDVLRVYGERYKPGVPETGKGLFCYQHSLGLTHEGYLYFFNNNSCNPDHWSLPSVEMVQEPASQADSFKRIWEYNCTVEGDQRLRFGSGGSAKELPDGSLFICMGSGYSKLLIVTRDKKVLWSALPERFMETDREWTPIHEYRSNLVTRQQLELLVWTAEENAARRSQDKKGHQ